MPRPELLAEAARQMTICNACRYCEGYCAVWPAIELRTAFKESDLLYLANLCFDCRDCFYACQYAPPHAFAVNPPQLFAQLREDTHAEYAWPGIFERAVRSNGRAVIVTATCCVLAILGLVLGFTGAPTVLSAQTGLGSFYRIVPYALMVAPFSLLAAYWLVVWGIGARRFWQAINVFMADVVSWPAFWQATGDVFGMRYLGGEGAGCTYPTAAFSQTRRWLHSLVFYGFLLDLASTTLAAIYDHLLGSPAPYPLFHPVVVLGTVGGIGLAIGCAGLLWLKARSDRAPAQDRILKMDTAFLSLLLLVSMTGLALLWLRDSAAMGTLLALHLGTVAALFLTAPYGKFYHAVFRYAAVIRNRLEQQQS